MNKKIFQYQDIEDAVTYFLREGNKAFNLKMPRPKIDYSLRGYSGGQVVHNYLTGERTLRVNLYVYRQDPGEYCLEIVGHEMAHVVQTYLDPNRKTTAHGPVWRKVMKAFDLEPKVTHNYDVQPARTTKIYDASCGCLKGHKVTKKVFLRIAAGEKYRCRRCKEYLEV